MNPILRWFGCAPEEKIYHDSANSGTDTQKLIKSQEFTVHQGDETREALTAWERKYPKDKCEVRGALKTYEYAQTILSDLNSEHILSLSNVDEIGCHLWALAKTSEKKIGYDDMFGYFFDNLPKVLGENNRDIAAKIRCAMIGSGNRQSYAQS